ncbi:hypothetical protein NEOLEDRAFT_1054748 [Neolentinus lepideus HHB14362 ss-1]|uniref:BTB domain-containing protein n=1 Tax=Neolentinus lepideus HHB14362 ss-1 TaxID=1314782 RepID=A0A165VWC5_9AGAM|nr:hypothetical protein NEOLEDRAFT_1054748 [Neolentinus lepideus HHB14362 ss-1]
MEKIHHKQFYYKDGSFRVQLGNILYNLHLSLLADRSLVFRNMLTMPLPEGMVAEGQSDENPMVLHPSIQPEEFDILMDYFFKGRNTGIPSLHYLTVLLKLSTMWEIEDGRDYVIDMFPKRPDFTPALQFHLGYTYHITTWVEPAFRKLLAMPFSKITEEIAHLMGPDAFYILSQTHTRIKTHHSILAFYPSDPIHSIECLRSGKCEQAWATEWWQGVAKHLLHPDLGKTGGEILEMLESVRIPGMCIDCQRANMEWVKDTGVMTRADDFIEEAVAQIVAWYGSSSKGKSTGSQQESRGEDEGDT